MADLRAEYPNPYVGPRAFRRGETLFGRDNEARRLLDLLLAERMVLFFAPSGAGKTSLIQAKLIPMLAEEEFLVLPHIGLRAGVELLADRDRNLDICNRYRFATFLSLEADRPREERLPLAELASVGFQEYWSRRFARTPDEEASCSRALVFDQFEEVFSLDPIDQPVKKAFFDELGTLLRDHRGLWALFALREDFLGTLEPYLACFPTRLRARYRLDLLGPESAAEAIQKPAQALGVTVTGAATEELIGNLRTVRVRRPGGGIEEKPGPHVEPVHLQVVCHFMWEKTLEGRQQGPPVTGPLRIELEDVRAAECKVFVNDQSAGGVDQALANFYEQCVERAARGDRARMRAIRDWIEQRLITPQGVRGLILLDPENIEPLNEEILRDLQDEHLIRRDRRGAVEFFELAHDRLIKPIKDSNARWREQHLSDLQKQAAFWQREGRPKRLLFSGSVLKAAREWAEAHPDQLTPVDREFLDLSQDSEDRDIIRKRNQVLKFLVPGAIAGFVALVVVTVLLLLTSDLNDRLEKKTAKLETTEQDLIEENDKLKKAKAQAEKAQQEAEKAKAEAEEARERARAELDNVKSALVVQKALEYQQAQLDLTMLFVHKANDLTSTPAGMNGLRSLLLSYPRLLQIVHPCSVCAKDSHLIKKVVLDAKNDRTVCLIGDDQLWLWDDLTSLTPARLAAGKEVAQIHDVAFLGGGPELVWVGSNQDKFFLCRLEPNQEGDPTVQVLGPKSANWHAALSPDGASVALAFEAEIKTWAVQPELKPAATFAYQTEDKEAKVTCLALAPAGKHLAAGIEVLGNGFTQSSARKDYVLLWRAGSPPPPRLKLIDPEARVLCLAFSADGSKLACGGEDQHVRLWEGLATAAAPQAGLKPTVGFRAHTKAVQGLAFAPDGLTLASGSSDKTVMLLYYVKDAKPRAWHLGPRLKGHGDTVTTLAFHPEGRTLFTGSYDGKFILWYVNDHKPLRQHVAPIQGVAWGPPGSNKFGTGSYDGKVIVWDKSKPTPQPTVLVGHKGKVQTVAFNKDGLIASGSWEDGRVLLWRADLRAEQKPLPVPTGLTEVQAVRFHPTNAKLLAVSGYAKTRGENVVQIWNLDAPDKVVVEIKTSEIVWKLAFSPDGSLLAGAGWDSVLLWQVGKEGALKQKGDPLKGGKGARWGVAFHPSGNWLASSHADGTVVLWPLTAANESHKFFLQGHSGTVEAVSFNPAGSVLASGGWDGTIVLWDTSSLGQATTPPQPYLPVLTGHKDEVWDLAFSPDQSVLVSAGQDCGVIVWDLNKILVPGWGPSTKERNWIDLSREIANRELTRPELELFWKLYESY